MKAALGAALPIVRRDQMLVRENGWLKDIGANNPAAFAESFLLDPFLVDAHGCHDLPSMADRMVVFAWTPLACILRMSHQLTVDIEPCRFLFQFPLCRDAGVSLTNQAPVPQMPACLLPGALRFVHLSLHGLLSALERGQRLDDDPPFAPLRQLQLSAEPVDGSILGVLPGLAALLQERFGLGQGLRDATHRLDSRLVQLPHIGLTVDPIISHIHTGPFPGFPQLRLDAHDGFQQTHLIAAVAIKAAA